LWNLILANKAGSVLIFWLWCLRHQVNLIERAFLKHCFGKSFPGDVVAVCRTLRLPGSHKRLLDANNEVFSRGCRLPGLRAKDIGDHLRSKVLKAKFGRPSITRWNSYKTPLAKIRAGMGSLPCIYLDAFSGAPCP